MLRRSVGVDDALTAAARGLALFGIPAGGRVPLPGWHQVCTTDASQVARLVTAGNLGVGCRASDVVGLDLDQHPGRPDGAASLAAICDAHRVTWPDTFTVRTPGGLHLYFRAGGRPVPSTSGGRSGLGPGIDIRGPGRRAGGYLVAPGSQVAGGTYRIAHDTPIAPLPTWIAGVLLS